MVTSRVPEPVVWRSSVCCINDTQLEQHQSGAQEQHCIEAMAPRRTLLFTVTVQAIASADVSRHFPNCSFW
jgi:hypothetical protein